MRLHVSLRPLSLLSVCLSVSTPTPIQNAVEMTGTFKQMKVRLVEEGFDPAGITDPLYILQERNQSYTPLTGQIYGSIVAGIIKLWTDLWWYYSWVLFIRACNWKRFKNVLQRKTKNEHYLVPPCFSPRQPSFFTCGIVWDRPPGQLMKLRSISVSNKALLCGKSHSDWLGLC